MNEMSQDAYLFKRTLLFPSIFQIEESLSFATSPSSLSNTHTQKIYSYKIMLSSASLLKCSSREEMTDNLFNVKKRNIGVPFLLKV